MPFNGSGTFSPYSPGNPVVTGTVISSTAFNNTQSDIASGLTNTVTRDGQSPPSANLPMGGNKLTGLAAGTVAGDSLRWEQLFSQGTEQDIASAATTDIGALNTTVVRVTGTTTITSFGTAYKGPRFVRFAGALTLTHNATTLILPTGANITTAAGDRAILTPVGNPAAGWQVLVYQRASGRSLADTDFLNTTRIDVASAATTDLTANAPNTRNINITGTTTITAFTVAVGQLYFVRFNAALTLTNNGSIVTQTGSSIVTAAGDTCIIRATSANVVEVLSYVKASQNLVREIQPITASVGSNALTLTLNPTVLDFRSSTLGSGTVNTRSVPAAITLTISSGSTLGTTNAVLSRLAVLAIDNAGTVELAVSNLSGAVNLNETGVISTTAEGGAGAADSATVVYSTTARTNVPYRIVGFIESTQATAGTWATAPSLIVCGVDLLAKWLSGYGQTWQLVTRTAGVTYNNLTGRKITLLKNINAAGAASCSAGIVINGGASITFLSSSAGTGPTAAASTMEIPEGASYVLSEVNVTATNNYELR